MNNDGLLDLFVANCGRNGLFLGRPDGRFNDVSAAWGIDIDARYDACAFSDYDHDGRLDLYVNGTVTGGDGLAELVGRPLRDQRAGGSVSTSPSGTRRAQPGLTSRLSVAQD
ncbi:MAG TPA: VCBS repeat-containing protein [Gemmatimonadaceae bacterium]